MNNMNQKISISEKIGYSLGGNCCANLVFQMMMIYQTKFYTDVFGLEGAIAGSVMLIAVCRCLCQADRGNLIRQDANPLG